MPLSSFMAQLLMSLRSTLFTKSVSMFQKEKSKGDKRSALLFSHFLDTFIHQDNSQSSHDLRRFPQICFVALFSDSIILTMDILFFYTSGVCKIEEYKRLQSQCNCLGLYSVAQSFPHAAVFVVFFCCFF